MECIYLELKFRMESMIIAPENWGFGNPRGRRTCGGQEFGWYYFKYDKKQDMIGLSDSILTFGMRKSWRNTRLPWLPISSRSTATRMMENLGSNQLR